MTQNLTPALATPNETGKKVVYVSSEGTSVVKRLRELLRTRELVWNLALRDIKVRYRQSVLGVAWAMFIPLSQMLLFTFVFTKIVPLKTDIPYAIFAYCGLLPWNFLSSSTSAAANSLVANRGLLTKIYFPAEVFPLSGIIASFVDFLVGTVLLVALTLWFLFSGHPITVSWTAFLAILVFFVQVVFIAGISFFLAMGNLFFRDVRYIYNVGVNLWMFASSVIYPMKTSNPRTQMLLNLNPVTPMLDAYRDVLLRGKMPDWSAFGYAAAVAVTMLMIGWITFYRMQHKFAEKA